MVFGMIGLLAFLATPVGAAEEQHPMPTPELVAKRTPLQKAKYPAIDVHFHSGT